MGWSFTGSYLVFGLLVFFNFMAVFILVIYCSKRLNPADLYPPRIGNGEKSQLQLPSTETNTDQVVVIMAGDQTPSYIATPSPQPPPPPPPRLPEEEGSSYSSAEKDRSVLLAPAGTCEEDS